MRNQSLVRVLRLWRVTSGQAYVSLSELAEQFGVCARTIRRDFEALEAAGIRVPHYADRYEDGKLLPRPDYRAARESL